MKSAQVMPIRDGDVTMTLAEALTHATLPPPVAGKVFYGLSRNGSYEAVKRGDLPSIQMGKKILVPVAPIAAQLGLKTSFDSRES